MPLVLHRRTAFAPWIEAERQREKFARFEYGRTMQVAYQEWRDNNLAAARASLRNRSTNNAS